MFHPNPRFLALLRGQNLKNNIFLKALSFPLMSPHLLESIVTKSL